MSKFNIVSYRLSKFIKGPPIMQSFDYFDIVSWKDGIVGNAHEPNIKPYFQVGGTGIRRGQYQYLMLITDLEKYGELFDFDGIIITWENPFGRSGLTFEDLANIKRFIRIQLG